MKSFNNQRGSISLIFAGIILLLALGTGLYILRVQQGGTAIKTNTTSPSSNASPVNRTSPSPVSSIQDEQVDFRLRFYKPTDSFFFDQKYPEELTQAQDNSLTPMSCTGQYDEDGNLPNPFTNPTLTGYIKILENKYKDNDTHEISAIFKCTPKQGKTILVYSLGPCGGGCKGIPYVGIENNSDIQEVAKVDESGAYYGCIKSLHLTKENQFYFKCISGDGGFSSASVYKLSLTDFSLSRIKYCFSGFTDPINFSGRFIKCE